MTVTEDAFRTAVSRIVHHFCVICPSAQQVFVLGDFKGWSTSASPMERTHDHVWQLSVSLPAGGRGRFSYFVIDREWMTGRAPFGSTFCMPGSWARVVCTDEQGRSVPLTRDAKSARPSAEVGVDNEPAGPTRRLRRPRPLF